MYKTVLIFITITFSAHLFPLPTRLGSITKELISELVTFFDYRDVRTAYLVFKNYHHKKEEEEKWYSRLTNKNIGLPNVRVAERALFGFESRKIQ